MELCDLLFKYQANATLNQALSEALKNPTAFITVVSENKEYKIEPTFLFYKSVASTKTSITLDSKFNIINRECGCLEFYRKHDCIHTVALYAMALMVLDKKGFDAEFEKYKRKVISKKHGDILNKLSNELKTANSYFGKIHLIPCIEACGHNYLLSLKVGFDKDYVVKSISEFIHFVENHVEYSYGQKLSFVHSYECLDDVSKEFYSFLANICNENTEKAVTIRKSHMLKILEIYQGESIYYKSNSELKLTERKIVKIDNVELVLNASELKVCTPNDSKVFICGVKNAYFIDDEFIYTYQYKNRMEGKIIDCLYKVDGGLMVDVNSENFISTLLPMIKGSITIENEFYEKYPIPDIKVDSFVSYENGNIYLNYKVISRPQDENSPYLNELLDGYFALVESFYFAKNKDGKYNICNIENQYKFLTSDLTALKSFGNVFFDESMKDIHAKKSGKTQINISYNVGLLDFTFENSTLTLEEIQTMLMAYHQKKKFVKLKDNTIIEINEEDAKEIDDFLEDFNISIKDIKKNVSKPLNYLLKLVEVKDNNLSLDSQLLKMITTIQNYKKSSFEPTEGFKNTLRPYQLEGFKWLKTLASFGFGGILADDMGLGKTLEIISFIESDEAIKPSLIVCPMSLVYNWENECIKWGLTSPVKLVLGSAVEREDIIRNIADNKKVIYITSYDSLRRDVSLYLSHFRFVIADEAQFIKNQFAQKSEAVKTLKSDINFALTGTPIENGLADLWSIFDYLMPGYLSNYSHFKSRYESLIVHDDTDALVKLQKRVSPFILRRRKSDVLTDLPDKIEDYYYCKMSDKQRAVYDAHVAKLKDDLARGENNILAMLTRLRQICITPELIYQEEFENTKINMAVDLIRSSVDAGHRILVFSQFAQSFSILTKELDRMEIKYFQLDGTTKAKTRMEMVEEFNSNPDIKVFAISLKAGGTGLNLVGADMVIHLDPWWNSSAENQATDRAYRIGQTKNVYVVKLICKDTIEEKVVKLQALKRELAESIVNSDEQNKVKLTKNDILELLD